MSVWSDIHKKSNKFQIKREDIIFEEMEYGDKRILKVIAHNVYRGVEYFVVNYGSHPCAYVVCNEEFLERKDEWGDIPDITVHGGVTWTEKLPGFIGKDAYCFGWDYGHAGDYDGFFKHLGNREYTTDMIVRECKSAIDQYFLALEKEA